MRTHSIATAALWGALLTLGTTAAAQTTLKTEKSDRYGAYLTDAQGRALYMFKADKQGQGKAQAQSNCYDACAKAWPPLLADAMPQAGPQIDKSLIGTIERKGGGRQVTYNGWPLYYFVKDAGPGEATGQDVKGFGAEWYLLSAEGKIVHAQEKSAAGKKH